MYRVLNPESTFPSIPESASEIFLDIETASGDPNRGALMPYHGDKIAGFAFTWDDHENVYYVPVNHNRESTLFDTGDEAVNCDPEKVLGLLETLLGRSDRRWINHNLKFDAHFITKFGANIRAKMVDTLTLSKLADAQRSQTYKLKDLAYRWLAIAPDEQDEVKTELERLGSKDYGDVCPEILGRYACADVNMNRELWRQIVRRRTDSPEVWDLEIELTRSLFDIERRGLRIDEDALSEQRIKTQSEIAKLESLIFDLSSGQINEPSSPTCLHAFFFLKHQFPVVNETQKGLPSTDTATLEAWLEDDELEQHHPLVDAVRTYRTHRQFLSLYVEGWSSLVDERSLIRPSYNQTVRTGRMSSYSPNIQQLNANAKKLIVPAPGNEFLSLDYSQIEFRIISVVIGDRNMMNAYCDNPNTDFHTYASELCSISRREAKVVNFGIAFGMGSEKLERSLRKMKSTRMSPSDVLLAYRAKFPKVFTASERLQKQAKTTGFVRTLYGRKRYLSASDARKALNSVVQGTAADIVKEVAVRLNTDRKLQDTGVSIRAIVHDEFLFEAPKGSFDETTIDHIKNLMQQNSIDLPVPLLVDGGLSESNWKGCT